MTLVEQMINFDYKSGKEDEENDFLVVKRKLFGLLSKFTKNSSHFLMRKYEEYILYIKRLLTNDKLREAEKTILFEVLICFRYFFFDFLFDFNYLLIILYFFLFILFLFIKFVSYLLFIILLFICFNFIYFSFNQIK